MSNAALADEVYTAIESLKDLPPLPQTAQRLLHELSNDDVDIGKLCKLIETSPALAARIVALASSAFFAGTQPVRSIQDAVVRVLGLNLVKNLVMSSAVNGAFEPALCGGFEPEKYWSETLLTALYAREFARLTRGEGRVEPDAAYLCGLLHNIGVVVLTHVAPSGMTEVFRMIRVCERPLMMMEKRELGVTHVEAGLCLAQRWQLPSEVKVAIQHHRDQSYSGDHWQTSVLIGFSKWIAEDVLSEHEDFLAATIPQGLGLEEESVDRVTRECAQRVDDVLELAKIFSAGGA